jgi:large subunit ribosomal protein L17
MKNSFVALFSLLFLAVASAFGECIWMRTGNKGSHRLIDSPLLLLLLLVRCTMMATFFISHLDSPFYVFLLPLSSSSQNQKAPSTCFHGRAPSYFVAQQVQPQQSPTQLDMTRHGKVGFAKLGKPADQRKALLRALTTEVIRHGRISTTLVRAKAVRKHVDHMIELGKRGDLHARRQALAWMYDKNLVHSLFEAAPGRYGEQNGGYTRVLRTVARQGDNAKMAIIELV